MQLENRDLTLERNVLWERAVLSSLCDRASGVAWFGFRVVFLLLVRFCLLVSSVVILRGAAGTAVPSTPRPFPNFVLSVRGGVNRE